MDAHCSAVERILGIVIYVGERENVRNFKSGGIFLSHRRNKEENMSGGGGVDGEVQYCRRRDRARVTFPDFFFLWRRNLGFRREKGESFCVKHHKDTCIVLRGGGVKLK
jgi:hypothetical protein